MTDARAPVLSVRSMSVTFGGTVALDKVSFEVHRGEVFGLIGPNGAGKSTLIDAITGYLPEAMGSTVFAGRDITGLRPDERVACGLVRTFQLLELFEDLTVRENLLVAAERRSWLASIWDLVRPGNIDAHNEAVERALETMGIAQFGSELPSGLSHGQRQLVSVARGLAAEPLLLLLDEPAAGLDSEETASLADLLSELANRGLTILLVDHDMGLVLNVCNRVHVLDFGRTVAEGAPDEVRVDERVVAAYLGDRRTDSDEQEAGIS